MLSTVCNPFFFRGLCPKDIEVDSVMVGDQSMEEERRKDTHGDGVFWPSLRQVFPFCSPVLRNRYLLV